MRKFILFGSLLAALFVGANNTFAQTKIKKVVLQGFWWDYANNNYPAGWCNYLADLAPRLKTMGIDAVWVPPSAKSASGTNGVGYGPMDAYDLGDKFQKNTVKTRIGTKDEYLRMIAVLHANGIEVIQDAVANHIDGAGSSSGSGGNDPAANQSVNGGFKNFRYVSYKTPGLDQSQNDYFTRSGRWSKNYTNFYPNPNFNCANGIAPDFFNNGCNSTSGDLCLDAFGPDISYESNAIGLSSNIPSSGSATISGITRPYFNPTQASGYMRNGGRDWLMWLKKQTGVDGLRWDAVKHFPYQVQEDYSYNVRFILPSWAQGGEAMFNVGEWVASKGDLDCYVNNVKTGASDKHMGTFDFGLRAFDSQGGLYGLVLGNGGFNLGSIPGAQQNERYTDYPTQRVHRTVPFVNNHDTFRPILDASGNYKPLGDANWTNGGELSPHIDPREPRLATAYAVIMALDGNPQLFFEDVFNVGSTGKRFTHLPTSTTDLPLNSDIANLIWCHQVLQFKNGDYFVPYSAVDHLVLERGGKALIGINDQWATWQNNTVNSQFAPGTVLKDYSGANGTATVTVGSGGSVVINTPPVNPALNAAGRHGYSVWAPVGQDANTYAPSRITQTSQEWEMADDLGDSHCSSLGQGGQLPAGSCSYRIVGKIYAAAGSAITYDFNDDPNVSGINNCLEFYTLNGIRLHCNCTVNDFSGSFTAPATDSWITAKIRHNPGIVCTSISPAPCNVAANPCAAVPAQKAFVRLNYTAPTTINGRFTAANNTSNTAFWTGAGGTNDFTNSANWENCRIPNAAFNTITIPPCTPYLTNIPAGLTGLWKDVAGNITNTPFNVRLIAFKGKNVNQVAVLYWSTADETNNAGFEIEKSLNGTNFEKIGFVVGNNTTSEQKNYNFNDYQFEKSAYYRLKQIDNDGKYEYTSSIFIENDAKNTFKLMPNPAKNELKIVAGDNHNANDILTLSIYSSLGQMALRVQGNLSGINDALNGRVSELSQGLYLVDIQTQNGHQKLKLVKE